MTESTSDDLDLRVGLIAIRQEYLNLSELKHCLKVREKLLKKGRRIDDFGEILLQERYLTPENLEYIHMIGSADADQGMVSLADIEDEFKANVAEIKPGADFASLEIAEELGRGGMGVVYRAVDKSSGDDVALKILIRQDQATVRDIERFRKEATVMQPLIHSGIVKILDVGRYRGLDYIGMEYIRGKSLKELIEKRPKLPPVEALGIIRSAAEAVAFIHSHGIIHRDIKPENIMVRDSDGSAVLMDFGLAGWDKIEILAGRGSIGTPMYQPPEQAEVGGPYGKISEASDVYGLGATLYYLMTGKHPFSGRSVKEVREKIKKAPPTPMAAHRDDIPQIAEALVLRCMKKRQAERFSTPKDFIEAIDQVLGVLDPTGKARKASGRKSGKLQGKSGRTTGKRTRRRNTVGTKAVGKSKSPRKLKTQRVPAGRRSPTQEMPAYAIEQQWYENPIVLVMGGIVLILLLFITGALLIE